LGDLLLRKYSEHSKPDIAALERYLTAVLDKLKHDAKSRGFEIDGV
jgi:hypothetical protein